MQNNGAGLTSPTSPLRTLMDRYEWPNCTGWLRDADVLHAGALMDDIATVLRCTTYGTL